MFYKNIFEVMPIWMYGWMSTFSGTPVFANILYQLYNVVFTCLPIIWFATYDWEHNKHMLLKRPNLYWIGINDVYFNSYVFWRWFFYGVGQSSMIMIICFWTIGGLFPNGKTGDIEGTGNLVFLLLVITVNIKVLLSSS